MKWGGGGGRGGGPSNWGNDFEMGRVDTPLRTMYLL